MTRWRSLASRQFAAAMRANIDCIRECAAVGWAPQGTALDLGCWDGANYVTYAPPGMYMKGVEVDPDASEIARSRGIDVTVANLDCPLPFDDCSVDLVTSNQVIEHVADTDEFLKEARRVLRPGGRLVVSTENLASWHNIGALLFGWQPFSLTNVSSAVAGVGNPLAVLRDDEPQAPAWQHRRLFSYRGLAELVCAHHFEEVRVLGVGYYPLPAMAGRWDPRHAAFITAVATAC